MKCYGQSLSIRRNMCRVSKKKYKNSYSVSSLWNEEKIPIFIINVLLYSAYCSILQNFLQLPSWVDPASLQLVTGPSATVRFFFFPSKIINVSPKM